MNSKVEIQEGKKMNGETNTTWDGLKIVVMHVSNGSQSMNIPVTVLEIAQRLLNAVLPKAFQTCPIQSKYRFTGLRFDRKLNFEILVAESADSVSIFALHFVLVTCRWRNVHWRD